MKKFLILITILSSLSSMAFVSYANSSNFTYAEEATELRNMNLYKGISTTSWEPDLSSRLDRQTAVVLLLRVFGLEPEAEKIDIEIAKKNLSTKFSDAETISDWAIKQVYYAVSTDIVAGFPSGEFKPKDDLTGMQYCKLVLKLLGYQDFLFEDSVKVFYKVSDTTDEEVEVFGSQKGIVKDTMIGITYRALVAYVADTKATILEALVKIGVVKKDTIPQEYQIWVQEAEEASENNIYVMLPWLKPSEDVFRSTVDDKVTAEKDLPESGDENEQISEQPNDVVVESSDKEDVKQMIVTSVSPTAVREVTVSFSKAVQNYQDVVFTLSGLQVIPLSATWNESKTEAYLLLSIDLVLGKYTLVISDLTLDDQKNTFSFTAQNNEISKFEFFNTVLVKDQNYSDNGNYDMFTTYRAIDSYGNDMTNTMLSSQVNIFVNKKMKYPSFTLQPITNTITFHFNEAIETNASDIVVLVNSEDGKTTFANTNFKIGDAPAVENLQLGEIQFPTGVDRIRTGVNTAAYIPVEIKDQYDGNFISVEGFSKSVDILKEDKNLLVEVEEFYNEEAKRTQLRLRIDTSYILDTLETNIYLIVKKNANMVKQSLSIFGETKPSKIIFDKPKSMVANGDSPESLVLPFTVLDSNGNTLAVDEVIRQYELGNLSQLWSSGGNVAIAKNGPNKGNIINVSKIQAKGSFVVSLQAGTSSFTTTINTMDEPYPARVQIDSPNESIHMLYGAPQTITFTFIDQYGRKYPEYKILENSNIANSLIKVTIYNPTFAKFAFRVAGNLIGTEQEGEEGSYATLENTSTPQTLYTRAKYLIGKDTWTITGNPVSTAVSSNIDIRVLKSDIPRSPNLKDYKELSVLNIKLSLIPNLLQSYQYEVLDIPTLWAPKDRNIAIDGTDPYARAIRLIAMDGDKKYPVPADKIKSITIEEGEAHAKVSLLSGSALISNQSESWVLGAKKATDDIDKKITVNILVSVEGGTKELTKEVVLSSTDRKVQKVVFAKMKQTDKQTSELPVDILRYPFAVVQAAEEITGVYGLTSDILEEKFYVYEVDQYGVYRYIDNPSFRVDAIDKFKGDLYYSSNKLFFNKNQITANTPVPLEYLASDGVTKSTFNLTVLDGTYKFEADTQPPSLMFALSESDKSVFVKLTDKNEPHVLDQVTKKSLSSGINYSDLFETTSPNAKVTGAFWDKGSSRFLLFISEPLLDAQYIRLKPNRLGDSLGNTIVNFISIAKGQGEGYPLIAP